MDEDMEGETRKQVTSEVVLWEIKEEELKVSDTMKRKQPHRN